jgi:GNAT superfamily N-acetyltransferase
MERKRVLQDRESEEIMLNQWQPLQTVLYDGWVLRFADGYTKRANSVNPIYFSSLAVHEKIRYCEKLYAAHGLNTVFKITPFVQPEHLDEILASEGYAFMDPCSVQRRELAVVPQPEVRSVRVEEEMSGGWIDRFCSMQPVEKRHRTTMSRMLSNRCGDKGFFTLYHEGDAVACGLGIVDRGVLGIYDVVTGAEYRNRGFGEQLLLNIMRWGRERGAERAELAVLLNNAPALRLYEKLGFREIYQYWYRVKEECR